MHRKPLTHLQVAVRALGTVLAAVLLGGAVFSASALASASALVAAAPVVATTSVSGHPDTTSASGPACTASANGPVWALDAYTSKVTAIQTGAGTWRVTLQDNGSFAGFADPATCAAALSAGNFTGDYTVAVSSPVAPSAAFLHSSYSGAVSTTQMVTDLFDDATGVKVTGGDYFFIYQNGNYVQTTSSIYGDVTANGGAVSGLHAVALTATTASLAWNAVNRATRYAVTVVSPVHRATQFVTGTSVTLTGLHALTTYTVYVTAEPAVSGHSAVSFRTT